MIMSDKLLCINTSKPDAGISQFSMSSDDANHRGGMQRSSVTSTQSEWDGWSQLIPIGR